MPCWAAPYPGDLLGYLRDRRIGVAGCAARPGPAAEHAFVHTRRIPVRHGVDLRGQRRVDHARCDQVDPHPDCAWGWGYSAGCAATGE